MMHVFKRLQQWLHKTQRALRMHILISPDRMAQIFLNGKDLALRGRIIRSHVDTTMPAYVDICVGQYPMVRYRDVAMWRYLCLHIHTIAEERVLLDNEVCDWGFGPCNIKMPDSYGADKLQPSKRMLDLMRFQSMNHVQKTKFCAFIFSRYSRETRNLFYERLSSHKRVDASGPVFRNMPANAKRVTVDWYADVVRQYRPYKFVISFENSIGAQYQSEKICTGFAAGAVPIYWGCPNITSYYNPEAFINAHDFDSLEALAAYVIKVDADAALYQRYRTAPIFTPLQRDRIVKIFAQREQFFSAYIGNQKRIATLPQMQAGVFLRETVSRSRQNFVEEIFHERLKKGFSRRTKVLWPYR